MRSRKAGKQGQTILLWVVGETRKEKKRTCAQAAGIPGRAICQKASSGYRKSSERKEV